MPVHQVEDVVPVVVANKHFFIFFQINNFKKNERKFDMNQILTYLQNVPFALIAMVFMFIAKKIADWRTKEFDDDHEIEEKSNMAVGIRRAGLYLGMGIAMAGSIAGASKGFMVDLKNFLIDGSLIVVLMFIARAINDGIILHGINNDREAKNGNAAVGITEFASYVASGLILNGSFTGEGGGIVSTLVFFGLGQIALIVFYGIYQAITAFDVTKEIKDKNTAAAIAVLGILASLGLILRTSIAGPFVSWKADIISFGISLAIGIALLLTFRYLVDRFFLPNTDLKTEVHNDRNNAALILTACMIFAGSLVISTVM